MQHYIMWSKVKGETVPKPDSVIFAYPNQELKLMHPPRGCVLHERKISF